MPGKVIITTGLPGSGKSTWTLEQIIQNPDWLRLELDQLRDEFGINRKEYDPEGEKNIRLVRDQRLLEALKAGKTVICSDTNLTESTLKRLQSLADQAKAEVAYQDFTHVPPEVCIERDAKREHSVGEAVIWRMYSKIRPDDEIRADRNHLIIGDVHGDWVRLESLLAHHGITVTDQGIENRYNYFVVFLGDLNDPRLEDEEANRSQMSSIRCIEIAYRLYKGGMAELVQSNHQTNMINLYYGRRKKLSYGLSYTAEEMERQERSWLDKLINWLDSRPYFYSFVENGQLFTCTHAYYTPGMSQYHPGGEAASAALYGLKDAEGSRLNWWEDSQYFQQDRILISGHYHVQGYFPDSEHPKAILLDGECGCTGGKLLGFIPSTMQISSH